MAMDPDSERWPAKRRAELLRRPDVRAVREECRAIADAQGDMVDKILTYEAEFTARVSRLPNEEPVVDGSDED